ncbi:MAG: class III signal peptide-containing protein [Candidatus Omnitrophota bacterium]|jgi:uncharacterized protein (UPF0333 family)|nr:MAG: class III signal peptide-containing protein [Candidatus Omnitrophota bacterium]
MLSKRGQSTLEYVLILTAIIAAIILVANNFVRPRVGSSLDHVTNQMEQQANRIQFGAAPVE